ncbi:MAG TPA: hypothetical protein VMX94_00595, partial [Armatimonadota bacterium]|nr:hypothetical protein [Armatimonadota bacterium]
IRIAFELYASLVVSYPGWYIDDVTITGVPASIPISPPVTGSFAEGAWEGNVIVSQEASTMYLNADDNNGHVGTSNAFAVVAATTKTLTVQSIPITGVSITGDHPGATNYTAVCDDGENVTLTASSTPCANGVKYYFECWIVDNQLKPIGQVALQLPIAADHVVTALYTPRLPGDTNGDCRVNILDLIQVRGKLNTQCTQCSP